MAHLIARSARLRGVAVVAAAAGLVAASSAIAGVARSAPQLPPVTAERLVANVLRAVAGDPAVSGDVTAHVDLGLPDLPNEGGAGPTGPAAMLASLSGDHRLRVWHSRDGSRLSDLVPAGERSIVVSRTQAWLWDSTTMTAVRLGAGADAGAGAAAGASASMIDPVALARRALQALDASTAISVSGTISVAGRDAYVLTLRPRTDATLVGRVELFVDEARWLPLGGAIYARGATGPAVSARFTSVSFGAVDPAVYRFQPPPGARVITPKAPPARTQSGCQPWMECPVPTSGGPVANEGRGGSGAGSPDVRVFGRGWAAILAVRVPPPDALRRAAAGSGLNPLALLPFSGTLFSVDLVNRGDHGWLTIGAVPKAALERVAAELP